MVKRLLEIQAGELLAARGLRLAVAESCTGGLLGHKITNVPESSAYYMGSVTAYTNEVKTRLLGVSATSLETYGAVSREIALELAQGIRKTLGADIGLSVTGIAGPSGGTAEKPVGLVWVGLAGPDGEEAHRYLWGGDRLQNKEFSADQALQVLVDYLSR